MKKHLPTIDNEFYTLVFKNPEAVKAAIVAVTAGKGTFTTIDGKGEDVLNTMVALMSSVMGTMLETGNEDKNILEAFAGMCALALNDAVERYMNREGGALN